MNKVSFLNSFSKSLLIITAFAAMFTACSHNDGQLPDGSSPAVRFTAKNIAIVQTRTTIDGANGTTQWEPGDAVGIFMTGDAGNHKYTVNNVTTGALSSDAANMLYYPQNGSAVNFTAYYPYNNSQTLSKYVVNVATQKTKADLANIDLLYAKTTSGYNKSTQLVNLEFKHALAKLKMKIMAGIGISDISDLTAIELQNVSTTADFDLSDGTTFSNRAQGNISPQITPTGADIQSEVILIPGRYTGKVKFTVNGKDYFWTVSDINFESGNQYDYHVTVNKDGLIITGSPNGATWGNGGSENISGTSNNP